MTRNCQFPVAGMEDRKQDRGRLFEECIKLRELRRDVLLLAIKIITIPASKQGELDSACAQNPVMKICPGYFENLGGGVHSEVSTMEYFRGNSHIVSVED